MPPPDAFLQQVPLLAEMDAAERTTFASSFKVHKLKKGQQLFSEGDPGDEMFLVEQGCIALGRVLPGGHDQPFAKMRAGEVFGEMSLLDGAPRCLYARAEEDSILWGLSRSAFDYLVTSKSKTCAKFLLNLSRTMARRLRKIDQQMAEVVDWALRSQAGKG